MPNQPGLRARKKQQRRQRIEAVAIDLFETRGFDHTTIDDIADRADISPRTFFYYFPTKEDVALADHASRLERITDVLVARPVGEAPWDALRASFLAVAADYESQRDLLIRRFTIMINNESVFARSLQLQAGWEHALTDALTQRGDDLVGIEPRLMAATALACLRSSVQHWVTSGHAGSLPELVDGCFERLAVGWAR